jgi:periplasmic iron binding protein
VFNRWAGPLVATLIVGGVALIVALNLNLNSSIPGSSSATSKADVPPPAPALATGSKPVGFREYPIGDELLREHMRIAAVWLPPIAMEGMPEMSAVGDVIHLEADIHAT